MAKLPFELNSGEEIQKQESSIYLKSTFQGIIGKAYLTNKRLVFVKSANHLFGLIGLLLPMFRAKVLWELPLKDIQHLEKPEERANKYKLNLQTSKGETYRITVNSDSSTWVDAIKKLK